MYVNVEAFQKPYQNDTSLLEKEKSLYMFCKIILKDSVILAIH